MIHGTLAHLIPQFSCFVRNGPLRGAPSNYAPSISLQVSRAHVCGSVCGVQLYPEALTASLIEALHAFDSRMPGFVTDNSLLHGCETRTSAPVTILRDRETCVCTGLPGLWPAGEGAGHAGGIVSASVDGIRVATGLLQHLGLAEDQTSAWSAIQNSDSIAEGY